MKAKIYTSKGELKQDFNLPKDFVKVSAESLLAQAVRVYEDNTHFCLSKVKTRSEVNISKKKIYKQKGTGGARHGAKSAHIFVGGGVVHGPQGVKRTLLLPLKMKKVALLASLSNKFESGKAIVVEGFSKIKKTKDASILIKSIKSKLDIKSKVLVTLSSKNATISKFFKNLEDVEVVMNKDLNAYLVLKKSLVLVDADVFEQEPKIKIKNK